MSYHITFHGPEGIDKFHLGSANELEMLGQWVESLPSTMGLGLRQLINDGEYKGSHDIANDLRMALRLHPPDSEPVKETVNEMVQRLGVGHPHETVSITDD